jgi:hypothetical protein
VIDDMTQKGILRNPKGKNIDVQSKGKLIGVIDEPSRKGKIRKESMCD